MSSWTAVAGSWGLVSVIVVLGWYYYAGDSGHYRRIGKQKINGSIESVQEIVEDILPKESQKKQKKKAQKLTTTPAKIEGNSEPAPKSTVPVKTSEPGLTKRKDVKVNKSAQSLSVDPITPKENKAHKETDTDIKEFALQMAKAKAGTTFSGATKENQRVRTRKQSKVDGSSGPNAVDRETSYSGTSSNTGIDADDDLSSANSPGFSAVTSPADTTGVSDMLELAGSGPASLRIIDSLVPSKSKNASIKKQEVVETKKQRSNRLRRDREKEANREAESQRRILEEKQRRTAREAEGRLAKNGNGWTYDSGVPANAWSSGKTKAQPVANVNGSLLDTTEETPKSQTIIKTAPQLSNGVKPNGLNGTNSNWNDDLPSEEEQLRLIQEQSGESEWTTVSPPKRGKRKEQAGL